MSATIASVARRWGFTDATHFGRAFKEAYRMSPRDWRALKQGRDR
jgi:AraC-like DNA-binding protein